MYAMPTLTVRTKVQYQKIRAQHNSYEGLVEEGFDLSDEGDQIETQFYAKVASKTIMNQLTKTQRKVVVCLSEGRSRKEIAGIFHISLQEVHQIIARIRRRIQDRNMDEVQVQNVKNLVWWICYYRNCSAKQVYDSWHSDTVFNDYPRPSLGTLKKWVKEYKTE